MVAGKRWWLAGAVALVGVVGSTGCAQLGKLRTTFGQLNEVRVAVNQSVACDGVGVKLMNGVLLEVNVVNVKNAPVSEEGRKDLALRIARKAHETYRGETPVWNVHVILVKQRTLLFFFHWQESVGYRFGAGQLRGAAGPPVGTFGWATRSRG